jgi:hypothetical protein
MRPGIYTLTFFLILACKLTYAQEAYPLVKGNVDISIKKGTMFCDFFVSELPHIDFKDAKDFVFRINSGMNIRYFRDVKQGQNSLDYDVDTKDSVLADETKAYYIHENRGNPARYFPDEVELKYEGMYPVVPDSASGYMGGDWRGNIAFNGYSVRAEGWQAAWYPVLYNKKKQQRYERVRYNINITCDDCSVLFVNGSKPVKGNKANFVSDVPYEMAIYCGKFEAAEQHNTWILNPDMSSENQKLLFDLTASYGQYYAKHLGIPFKGDLTLVQTTPVADPKKWAFAFQVSPATFNVGVGKYGLASLFDATRGPRSRQSMAHELAHYYFGTLLRTNTIYRNIISEGFSEFMSFEVAKHLIGESEYEQLMTNKLNALKYLKNYKPLSQVKSEEDFGNREYYLYYYTLVLYTAIEKEIGEQAMWNWLKAMITTKTENTDYAFLESTLEIAVNDKNLAEKIKSKYFESNDALTNAIATIEQK